MLFVIWVPLLSVTVIASAVLWCCGRISARRRLQRELQWDEFIRSNQRLDSQLDQVWHGK
jgi:hypothetical protein